MRAGNSVSKDDEDIVRGIPSRIVSNAAREKLSTVMMEMTVEAKHKFKALRIVRVGATSRRTYCCATSGEASTGTVVNILSNNEDKAFEVVSVSY